MQVITHHEKEKWNEIVKSFSNWDVYYLCEYAESFMLHGDGTPYLFYFKDGSSRLCYVVLLNDIAEISAYKGHIKTGVYFDITTPYGYGGPIVEGEFKKRNQAKFLTELSQYCRENNIITQFLRFHPLFQNQVYMDSICEIFPIKDTITMDTISSDTIQKNLHSKNQNMIRKAKKVGVEIKQDNGERLDDFIRIYESTMDNNKASEYYYFSSDYYEFLRKEMSENVSFFYACKEEEIIGASIFLYNDQYMHYHLSGTQKEFREFASMNLLLYEAALWAEKKGIKQFHLGGGVSATDSLFKFKKQFNKNGYKHFYIGRNIFDEQVYNHLLQIRKMIDPKFNINNDKLIQYRKD
ncbi:MULTISPECIES: lipid II:glycine glycyltransferase FemX [Bacillaceae]|uniref:Lipid II:glycine glycyltransferase n=1 Tax=Evansella alkalicola TaxID=745819 RepID=A0ABS6JXX9_9BACI|nr:MULTISPECIES: peptidoglycan bridge formation glycyltransferase FemA/FemB family protein [Bacillaceae]MBU9723459.1 peptidoglycan bridge formation glycyltransferase FemA/FemB family protein [Bacillus alkalicola]